MSSIPSSPATDLECLKAFARRPDAETLRPVVDRYLGLVYSSALRRTADPLAAREVTLAVFSVLARRARRLRKTTVLARWLFHVTGVACRKRLTKPQRVRRWRWFGPKAAGEIPVDQPLWPRLSPRIDEALDRLPPRQRDVVLQRAFLRRDWDSIVQLLRIRRTRGEKRLARGLKKVAARLSTKDVKLDGETLSQLCLAENGSATAPEGLALDALAEIHATLDKKPSSELTRRTLRSLAWMRWRRRVVIATPSLVAFLTILAATAWYIDSLSGHSRSIATFLVWSVRNEAKSIPALATPARPWPSDPRLRLNAASVRAPEELFRTTNIWPVHLKFSPEQWRALEPRRIGALPHFLQPDGTVLLRHPEAKRSGLAGVLGFDFDWTHADFEFGGVLFTNVAARIKGNGTYLASLYGSKRAFKVDLNKFTSGQKLGGLDEITLNNMVNDFSCMSDALGYEFFRNAGVPAPRTAYAYLSVSVDTQWEGKPLGLYALVESVDADFAADRFGSRRTPIFKPVTYQLFEHLGNDWQAYAAIYDLKTKATEAQQQRVIDFARLVSQADDSEFARQLGDFLDLEAFARFLAGNILLSNYDSFLSNGQNFYVYLDPRSNKFGFIPWDLDLAWGGFFLLGTTRERERASIWHPWVGQNRFLERVMAVEEFRRIYRSYLEDFLARLFVPERLHRRVDEMGAIVRSAVAAESAFRVAKFDQAVGEPSERSPSRGNSQGLNRPAHQLKRFINKRVVSVRQQLDGESEGIILRRGERR